MDDLAFLAVMANLTTYFATGWGLAMADIPTLAAESRDQCWDLGGRMEYVYRRAVWMLVAWPLVGPTRFLRRRLVAEVEEAVLDEMAEERPARYQLLRDAA